ncbi:MAG: hypothetical protein ACRDOO_22715 [Actinomadura sp.]
MMALYSVLLIGVPIAIAATSVAIGVVGVRNYLQEVRGPADGDG